MKQYVLLKQVSSIGRATKYNNERTCNGKSIDKDKSDEQLKTRIKLIDQKDNLKTLSNVT